MPKVKDWAGPLRSKVEDQLNPLDWLAASAARRSKIIKKGAREGFSALAQNPLQAFPGHILGPSAAGSQAIDNDTRFEQLMAQMEELVQSTRAQQQRNEAQEQVNRKKEIQIEAVGQISVTEGTTELVPEEFQKIINQVGNPALQTSVPSEEKRWLETNTSRKLEAGTTDLNKQI
ncbi:hypothetical protein FNV43_RR11194 [Rhamnella rubrinervis]|uniref:Uncharacterized protein n=1 Tax=Rhamnella rubrinervis TaxID=2594499 RepID=A0A8K0MHE4_9ROSA|nr:hypothetical protein FNV43_RR11194 [Rhamnella rubrinervis]